MPRKKKAKTGRLLTRAKQEQNRTANLLAEAEELMTSLRKRERDIELQEIQRRRAVCWMMTACASLALYPESKLEFAVRDADQMLLEFSKRKFG